MPSAAEKFLKQKRGEQRFNSMMKMNSIAPSASRRHGLDKMGGYMTDVGPYTGKGPDGITQRTVPTQRRIDKNGKEYIVDENEVVVIDSATLDAYGGPEALNRFIKQNAPNGGPPQYYNGGVPTPQTQGNQPMPNGYSPGGVTPPMARNGGMMQGQTSYRQMACGGTPTRQYYNGGVPTTRNRAISKEQAEMLQEVQNDIQQYQTGGTPTNKTVNPFQIEKQDPVTPNVPNINIGQNLGTQTPDIPNIGSIQTGNQTGKLPWQQGGSTPWQQVGGQTGKVPSGKTTPNINIPDIGGKVPDISGKTPVTGGGNYPWQKTVGGGGYQEWLKKFQDSQQGIHTPIKDPNITGKLPVQTQRTPITGPIQITDPHGVVDPNQVVVPDDPWQTSTVPIDPNTGKPILTERPPVVAPDITQDVQPTQVPTGPVYDVGNLEEMMAGRYLDRLGAQQEAARAGEAQRGLQAGLSEREILGRQAIGDIGRREQVADVTTDLAMDAAARAEQRQAQQQALGMQQQQIDFAKQKYGDLEGQRIAQDIAQGMTYDLIKAKYPNVTEADYNSMKQAGPLGQMDWQKEQWQQQFDFQQDQWDVANQQSAFGTLMATGDYKNAAKMFKDIYGQSIDFTHLTNEQDAMKFNEGWNNMNGLIAAGTNWENALKVMKQDGTLEKLGMTESDVKSFYQESQMMNDPMYKAMKMSDTWVQQGLITQDQADDYTAFLQWSITNPQGVTIEDGFSVYDANGNEMGFFKTQGEADKFVADNPNLNYTTKPVENHVSIGGTTGTSGTGTQVEVLEGFDNFLTGLPADAPADLSDWYSQEQWEAMGKPKNWNDAKSWMNDPAKINKYIKDNYNIETPSMNNMKEEDRKLVMNSIMGGNEKLKEQYYYPENEDTIQSINKAMKVGLEQPDVDGYGVSYDGSGNLHVQMPWKHWKDTVVDMEPGKIMDVSLPNGEKASVVVNSNETVHPSTDPDAPDGTSTMSVTDVNTGKTYDLVFDVTWAFWN